MIFFEKGTTGIADLETTKPNNKGAASSLRAGKKELYLCSLHLRKENAYSTHLKLLKTVPHVKW